MTRLHLPDAIDVGLYATGNGGVSWCLANSQRGADYQWFHLFINPELPYETVHAHIWRQIPRNESVSVEYIEPTLNLRIYQERDEETRLPSAVLRITV